MEHYASEQEQVEALKRWWKDNGRPLVFGLAIGIAALAGYRYWDAMQTARAEDASQNYSAMLQMMNDQRIDDARTTGQAIIDTYPDSTYARLSALLLAKLAADTEDYARARELLTPLVEGAGDSEVAPLARARLARLALAEGNADTAAAYMAKVPPTADEDRFAELRGDILVAQGKPDAARPLYLEALALAEKLGLERGAIQLKLDNLGASGS
ncbi:MAG: tetratricopeptide repeat protein [Gammaproteobacteria bacterium]|nr:tetratricopeptide repeat protein [Gammaproteobacteria bacterium]MCP5200715.1 tetratricopeptide repeat protein [Gammaproteobacteria bacterium]